MDKSNKIVWGISIFLACVLTLIWAISRIMGIKLPDMAVRIMGILDIILIPVIVKTSISIRRNRD